MAGPFLLATLPIDGASGVPHTEPVLVALDSDNPCVAASVEMTLAGTLAITGGVFQAGFAGTIVAVPPNALSIEVTTHPPFVQDAITAHIQVTDTAALSGDFTFSFVSPQEHISDLKAKTWCEGKRIDLSWANPTGTVPAIAQMRIVRSQYSYLTSYDEPGDEIYIGTAIEAFIDGVYTGPITTSNTALDEDKFYYYTIFMSYDVTAGPTRIWIRIDPSPDHVEGLSIKDYFAKEGHYVYGLLPRAYRRRDSEPERGADRYRLRNYCLFLQCGINMYRGWMEGMLRLRDPDTGPAGRLGVASNQLGLLSASAWDLGIGTESSFDAGVLRRIALGIIGVYKKKGTCPGLVSLAKVMTTWDTRCDEMIEPVCGINRIFRLWDGESYFGFVNDEIAADPNYTPPGTVVIDSTVAGQLTIPKVDVVDAGGTGSALPLTSSAIPTAVSALTDLGDFACIDDVDEVGADYVITFTDPTAFLRCEIVGAGTGGVGTFQITSIDTTSYPWQFPTPLVEPLYGINAFKGKKLQDSTGAIHDVLSNVGTTGGVTDLVLATNPATGAFSIAEDFGAGGGTFATREPHLNLRFIVGESSFTADTIWDTRLLNELAFGPWSLITGLGSIGGLSATPGPADVILWVANQHNVLSRSTAIESNVLTDTTQTWTTNEWAGYYLLPNWGTSKLYKIVGNIATELYVTVSGGGLETVATAGTYFVILTDENAARYQRLTRLLTNFVPHESLGIVKFETVP
jgi:hypothetical protein